MTTDREILLSIYSDMYKDAYGGRPRDSRILSMGEEDIRAEMDKIQEEILRQIKEEEES